MTSNLDIYRTASVLIREHGEEAALEAAQRADAMLEKGSLDGQRVWKLRHSLSAVQTQLLPATLSTALGAPARSRAG